MNRQGSVVEAKDLPEAMAPARLKPVGWLGFRAYRDVLPLIVAVPPANDAAGDRC